MRADGRRLAFASELQALQRVPGFDATVSVDAMAEVLMLPVHRRAAHDLPHRQEAAARPLAAASARRTAHDRALLRVRARRARAFEQRSLDDLADELEEILVRSAAAPADLRRAARRIPLGRRRLVDGLCARSAQAGRPAQDVLDRLRRARRASTRPHAQFAEHLGTEHHEQRPRARRRSNSCSTSARCSTSRTATAPACRPTCCRSSRAST